MKPYSSRSTIISTAGFLALSLVGCERRITDDGPTPEAERFAAKMCAAATECDCATRFDSEEQCVESFSERFTTAQRSLELDAECFEAFLEDSRIDACADFGDLVSLADCTSLRGSKKEGEPCSAYSELLSPLSINECEEELFCLVGTCVRYTPMIPIPRKQPGERCDVSFPASCGIFVPTHCGNDGICRESAGENEPCTSPFGCAEPGSALYCRFGGEEVGTCVPRVEVGGACDPMDHWTCLGVVSEDASGGASVGAAWCDVSTRTCAEGRAPAVCESVTNPAAWPS
jgi:hypothetical protein